MPGERSGPALAIGARREARAGVDLARIAHARTGTAGKKAVAVAGGRGRICRDRGSDGLGAVAQAVRSGDIYAFPDPAARKRGFRPVDGIVTRWTQACIQYHRAAARRGDSRPGCARVKASGRLRKTKQSLLVAG